MSYRITMPCHFGMEAVLKRELKSLGYDTAEVTDGRVSIDGDALAIVRANMELTTAERVLIEVGCFKAREFEDLFQGIQSIPWEEYIPADGRFWVTKAGSTDSKLASIPTIQSVAKKAMVKRLGSHYGIEHFAEDGDDHPVRIFLFKDEARVYLDTTGTPLHKRGYRALTAAAPIAETLAAAIIHLTPWHADRLLWDPFCGSGTFVIEAAMMAAGIAPGLKRQFTAEKWKMITPQRMWDEHRRELKSHVNRNVKTSIIGSDIDPKMIQIARKNAEAAGVAELIDLKCQDVSKVHSDASYGFMITNPPYGERLENEETLPDIYGSLGEVFFNMDEWSLFMISGYEDSERYLGKKADKKRKLYNGMMRTQLYQYMGARPPKKQG